MCINQGDIFRVQLDNADIPHPHVVIQESDSGIVTLCALTSNLKRISLPGNILLDAGEANLPKPSVVEVAKVSTVEKAQLGEYIGTLVEQRMNQVLAGIRFLQASFFDRQDDLL